MTKAIPITVRLGLTAAVLLTARASTAQQVTNPIPTPIVTGSVRVRIDDYVQMPATLSTVGKPDYSTGARGRINFLRESPDGRLFVNDLRGQLYTLDANFQPQLYLDIDAANGGAGSIFPATWYSNGLAAGFISFNFHPEFATNGKFYTIHLEDPANTAAVPDFSTVDQRSGSHPVRWHTVITEWTAASPLAPTWNEATGTRRELLRVGTTADAYFHPYGDLQFNPLAEPGDSDYGKLYISGGDWGYINGAGAPQGAGTEGQPGQLQRLDTLAGTMIRIDPRSPAETGSAAGIGDYTIPADNPFVDGNPNTFDEIYAFGFRNGHRMAWDTEGGQLYVMNVGHANLEEIERIIPGGNYGWGVREGTFVNGNDLANGGDGDADHVFVNNVPNAADVDFRGQEYLYPVAQYDHGEGNANAGGFVYRGQAISQLQNKYVFGDIVTGRVFVADMDAIQSVDITEPFTNVLIEELQLYTVNANGVETDINDLRTIVGNSRADLRFGLDSLGEIYILTKTDGYIRKLVPDALYGDFDRSGEINLQDYLILVGNLHTDVSAMSPALSYHLGDINRDRAINFFDFAAFRNAYLSGGGSWEDLFATGIPEPSTAILLLIGAVLGVSRRTIRRHTLPMILAALPLLATLQPREVHAANVTMNASDALAGNQSSLDTDLGNGNHWNNGAVPSAANDYFTGNFILRTPVNSSSLTFAGNSLTVNNTNGFNDGGIFYKGFGTTGVITINNLILNGGSITHQSSSADLFQLAGNLNVTGNSRLYARQGSINVSAPISGSASITNPGSDCGNCTLIFSSLSNSFTGNLINNGRFQLADNSALNFVIGASGVNNQVSGAGAQTVFNGDFNFNLSGASTNLGDSWPIVTAANRSFGSTFSVAGFTEITPGTWQSGVYQFSESTGLLSVVQPPSLLTLRVNRNNGEVSIVNANASGTINMNYYQIQSDSGALSIAGWKSIDGDLPPSTTTWEKAIPGSFEELISETNLLGSVALAPTNSVSLGQAFAGTILADEDLRFFYSTTDNSTTLFTGHIEYFTAPSLLGDYTGDEAVDAADYVLWRKNGGLEPRYEIWQTRFGNTGGGGGSLATTADNASVPEPSAGLLMFLGGVAILAQPRRRLYPDF